MKVKDLEEKMKKCDADRQLVEEQLSDEIRKQRATIDQFERSLGVRSSYATKSSQSVRALVELLEGQKGELAIQNEALRTEVESLKKQLHDLSENNSGLESDMERLRAGALQKATAAVQADLVALRSQCKILQQETATAKEKSDMQDEHLKREHESRRSVEEQKDRLERQVQSHAALVSSQSLTSLLLLD